MGQLFNSKGKGGLVILAEGDSWFDYPKITGVRNIIVHLEKTGYNIKNVSHTGHTLLDMAYGTITDKHFRYHNQQQIDETLLLVSQMQPDIVLLSAGGNDVAGTELESFINHSKSGLSALRMEVLDYAINTVFKTAFRKFFNLVRNHKADVQFVVHGYGNPPVNGDGVGFDLKNFGFSGPWLLPAFAKNNRTNRQENDATMEEVMKMFNDMLKSVAESEANVHYMDLRPHIKTSDWVNELHLTDNGYKKVAKKFDEVIQTL